MKQVVFIAVSFMLGLSLKAQDSTGHKMMHQKMQHKMGDCVMMENGKMMQMKAGKTMVLTSDVTLSDGSIVMANGTMKKKDGTNVTLKDGDCVMMNGSIRHMEMKKMKKE